MARFGCPACQSESVTEVNTVIAECHVSEWSEDGTPIDCMDSNVVWETAEPVEEEPYVCRDCGRRFDQPQRLASASAETQEAPRQHSDLFNFLSDVLRP